MSDINSTAAAQTEVAVDTSAMRLDYDGNFMPAVHKFGKFTMVGGFLLSFLPVAWLYFVGGYRAPADIYSQVTFAVTAYGFSMWLTEPLSYFPILGAAGTYMGYFAGNVGNMRAPVAMSIQSSLEEEVTSPRGNLATIIAIAISVFVNLAILLVIVLSGSAIIQVLPETITKAFAYTLPALQASMLVMRGMGNPKRTLQYFPATIALYFICAAVPALTKWSMVICIGGTILWAYALFRMDIAKKQRAA